MKVVESHRVHDSHVCVLAELTPQATVHPSDGSWYQLRQSQPRIELAKKHCKAPEPRETTTAAKPRSSEDGTQCGGLRCRFNYWHIALDSDASSQALGGRRGLLLETPVSTPFDGLGKLTIGRSSVQPVPSCEGTARIASPAYTCRHMMTQAATCHEIDHVRDDSVTQLMRK